MNKMKKVLDLQLNEVREKIDVVNLIIDNEHDKEINYREGKKNYDEIKKDVENNLDSYFDLYEFRELGEEKDE